MTELISNDTPGNVGRHARLMRTLAACQSFLCLSEEPEDQSTRIARFNDALVQLEDEQGFLRVLWDSERDKEEFAELVQLAWRFQLEDGRVEHAICLDL